MKGKSSQHLSLQLAGWLARVNHWKKLASDAALSEPPKSRLGCLSLIDKKMTLEAALMQLHVCAELREQHAITQHTRQLCDHLTPSTLWHESLRACLLSLREHAHDTVTHVCVVQLLYACGLRWGSAQKITPPHSLWPWSSQDSAVLQRTLKLVTEKPIERSVACESFISHLDEHRIKAKVDAMGLFQHASELEDTSSVPVQEPARWMEQRYLKPCLLAACLCTGVVLLEALYVGKHVSAMSLALSHTSLWAMPVLLSEWSLLVMLTVVLWGQVFHFSTGERSVTLKSLQGRHYFTAVVLIASGLFIDFEMHLSLGAALTLGVFCAILAAWNVLGWQKSLSVEHLQQRVDDWVTRANEHLAPRTHTSVGSIDELWAQSSDAHTSQAAVRPSELSDASLSRR